MLRSFTAVCSFSYRSMISSGLENLSGLLNSHEDTIVASLSAGQDIMSQMIGAGELNEQLSVAMANLDAVFRGHLSEYNTLLRPIVASFKQHSMRFSEEIEPRVATLRSEFRTNLDETLNALGPVVNTLMKMASNFRESASMYVEEYRRNMEEFYSQLERMSPEEKAKRRAEMEAIGQEIVAKFQKLYEVASGTPSQN